MRCWFSSYAINNKFNKANRSLLFAIDIFSKHACVVPLKNKKGITIANSIQKILDNSTRLRSMWKSNKISVDKGSEFYNSSFEKNG